MMDVADLNTGLCAERWPVDCDALEKGDVIRPEWIREILGIRPGGYIYPHQKLALAKQIEQTLWDRGRRWTVRALKTGIHILTDAEASVYNARMVNRRRRHMFTSHFKLTQVDTSQLDADTVRLHDVRLIRSGAQIAALAAARKQVEVQIHERKHPLLPGAECSK